MRDTAKKGWHIYATIKNRRACSHDALPEEEDVSVSNDHQVAIEGWKARKDQLYKQQKSVMEINDAAEKLNLLSLSKKKGASLNGPPTDQTSNIEP